MLTDQRGPPVNFYMAELWVVVVGQGTIEGQFKERGSGGWKHVNWENRKVEDSFHKRELDSKKPHCFKTMIY
jgi:hypothetical protein